MQHPSSRQGMRSAGTPSASARRPSLDANGSMASPPDALGGGHSAFLAQAANAAGGRTTSSARGSRPGQAPLVALPPTTLPAPQRPASTATPSRLAAGLNSPPVPPHTLRAVRTNVVPPVSTPLLHRISSEEYLATCISPHSDSAFGGDDELESGARSHSSSASSLASIPSSSPGLYMQRRSVTNGSVTPTTAGTPTSFLPPASGTSPRKRPEFLSPSLSASSVGAHSDSAAGSGTSPLSQRHGRYANAAAHSPNQQLQQPAAPSHASPASSSNSSSSLRHSYDLPSPPRTKPAGKSTPVRAHHLIGSASVSSMGIRTGHTDFTNAHDAHHRSTSVFAQAPPSNPIHNIWQRDTSANRGKPDGVRGTSKRGMPVPSSSHRPSSSHSAHRPVTARADLLSARDDGGVKGRSLAAALHDGPVQNPYTAHYNVARAPEQRLQTATVSSLGAQARARSAHVLRPPSRQRPPNQALHLESASHANAFSAAQSAAAQAVPAVRATSAARDNLWASGMSSNSSSGSSAARPSSSASNIRPGSSSFVPRPVSGGRSMHPLHSSVDLFPAAPIELVKAVKHQLRTMSSGSDRHISSSSTQRLSSASRHRASAADDDDAPVEILSNSSGLDDTDHTEGDTEDTASTITDDGEDTASLDDAAQAAHGASLLRPASADAFVSLHNILQLQSEKAGGGTARSKQIARLGSAGGAGSARLYAAFPSSGEGSASGTKVSSRQGTPSNRAASSSSRAAAPPGCSPDDDPFPLPPHHMRGPLGDAGNGNRPSSSRSSRREAT